ncbi:MAG: hypothetical protein PVI86_01550 [Phycisphaerae bacterium]|jgi:hypothetical protein
MTKEFLHYPKVGAVLQQPSRRGVPQHVRRDATVQGTRSGELRHYRADPLGRDRAPAVVNENAVVVKKEQCPSP